MIHDALVGVKRKCTRGWRSSQRLSSGVECVLEFSAAEECAALQSDRLLADIQLLAAEVRLLCGDWDEAAPQIEGGIEFALEHGNRITLPSSRRPSPSSLPRAATMRRPHVRSRPIDRLGEPHQERARGGRAGRRGAH